MKKYLFLLLSLLFISCENPIFIQKAGLYKVEFSTNGGSSISPYYTNVISEKPFTERNDYTFIGWYLNSEFQEDPILFPYTLSSNTTLYAKWQQNFTVSFETNEGTSIESYKTGIIYDIPETTKENCEFEGWYLQSDFSGDPVEFPFLVTKPTTLYAKWLVTYTVSFETNGGSLIDSFRTAQIEEKPKCEKTGYSLVGWYSDSELTNEIEFPLLLKEDMTFYARWQKQYNVSFDVAGGTPIETMVTGYIETPPETTKAESSVEGWYYDSEYISEVTFPLLLTSDLKLYVKWTGILCTITYDANGATEGDVPSEVTVPKGETYIISSNSGNLSKQGFAFTKWSTSSDGKSGKSFAARETTTITGDMTLYAQWGTDYAFMVDVEGGTFSMGSDYSGNASYLNGYTGPAHSVTMNSFKIGRYEVTYELWTEVYEWATSRSENTYNLKNAVKGKSLNDKFTDWEPATSMNLYDAIAWCNAYSEYKGFKPCYYQDTTYTEVYNDYTDRTVYWDKSSNGFRLPTEAEWEFAAKGGSNTKTYEYSGGNEYNKVAWNDQNETHPVGTKIPNSLDIYDMSGNVAEWCFTSYYSYTSDPQSNPNCIKRDASKGIYEPIFRGGPKSDASSTLYLYVYWREFIDSKRYSSNISYYGDNEFDYLGMRVAQNSN